MPFPAAQAGAAAEMADASEATRAAFGAHSLHDGTGISSRNNDGYGVVNSTADSADYGDCAAPELMRQQHRESAAAVAAEALEWEQRQVGTAVPLPATLWGLFYEEGLPSCFASYVMSPCMR